MSESIFRLVQTEQTSFTPTYDTSRLEPVPFGIKHIDAQMLMGVEPTIQGINVVQGPMGSRKTTHLLNIIINQCMSGQLPGDHLIIWWSLETSMSIERIGMIIRAMIASKLMIYAFHLDIDLKELAQAMLDLGRKPDPDEFTERCLIVTDLVRAIFAKPLPGHPPDRLVDMVAHQYGSQRINELGLKADAIKRMYVYPHKQQLTTYQALAYRIAGWIVCMFPIKVYGPSEHQDRQERQKRAFPTTSLERSAKEWERIAKYGNTQLFVDHITAFYFPDLEANPYHKQNRVVPVLKEFAGSNSALVWAVMQEGIGHAREFDRSGIVRGAEGGDTAGREADNNWRKDYKGQLYPHYDIVYYPVKSRHGVWNDFAQPIERNSGVYFGDSVDLSRVRHLFERV